MLLIILQYCTGREVEDTRAFQSSFVQHCTMTTFMTLAARAHNIYNMTWIKERYIGNPGLFHRSCEHVYVEVLNLEVVKWLYENGVPWGKNAL